jgi:hypothetical protein
MFSQVTVQGSAFSAFGAFSDKVAVAFPAPVVPTLGQFGQIAVSLPSWDFDISHQPTPYGN